MRELLPVADEHTVWEVINAGGVSYASYRVAALMEELTQYQPDLFVIFSAHNEFLERRTYAGMFSQPPWFLYFQATAVCIWTFALLDRWLLAKLALLTPQISCQPKSTNCLIIQSVLPTTDAILCGESGGLFSTTESICSGWSHWLMRLGRSCVRWPAANEKDRSPFKSDIRSDASESERAQIQDLLSRAHEAVAKHDYQLASELYRQSRCALIQAWQRSITNLGSRCLP